MERVSIKQVTKHFLVVAGLLIFMLFLLPIQSPNQYSPAIVTYVNSDTKLSSITLTPSNETRSYNVYDENDNKLMYNRVTGMVFSNVGVVYTQGSQPLFYDDSTEEFEDSMKRRLDLVEKSTNGLQNYYLMFEDYKVRSIGIHDELYVVGIAANTKFNSGDAYDMLITRVYVSRHWLIGWLVGYGYYEYYDLYGHEIDSKYLQTTVRPNLITGAGTSTLSGTVLTKFESWGTIKDLLEEIVYLMELVPPTGSPMGEFALNTNSGAYLRDDRGQKIRINENGQLIDPMGWPLIGSDARPLGWKEGLRAYTTHSKSLLHYGANDTLVENSGFIAHSVISNVLAGQRIYLVYLSDEITLLPVTLKTISTDPYQAEYYDMNSEKIELDEIVEPEISVDDRKTNYPDEFMTFWEEFKMFLNKVWEFLQTWGFLILIGILLVITLPFTLPVFTIIFQLLFNGLLALFKLLLAIIMLPIKLFKGRD